MDDFNSSTTSISEIFIHSGQLPDVVALNSVHELSDVGIDAKLSQFGQKGMHT